MTFSILRTIFISIILVLCTSLLQGGIWHFILPHWSVPNLTLIVILAVALHERAAQAVWFAALIGLLSDVCTGELLGPQMGAAVIVVTTVMLLVNRLFIDSVLTLGVICGGSSILFSLVRMLLAIQFSDKAVQSAGFIIFEAFLTAIVGMLLIRPILRLLGRSSRDGLDFDRGRMRRL